MLRRFSAAQAAKNRSRTCALCAVFFSTFGAGIITIERNNPVLNVENTGVDQILIMGKQNANNVERAVLTYSGSRWSGGISIKGKSNIGFKDIDISGNQDSSGLEVSVGAIVTLRNGTRILNNHSATGGGVFIEHGSIWPQNGRIINNNSQHGDANIKR
jgi:hypothetical protein